MKIENLTPHAINIVGGATIPPSGGVARVSSDTEIVDTINGIDIVKNSFGEIVGLPEEKTDTILIVSGMVRAALPARTDILSPGTLVRDANGNVIGCQNLISNK